MLLNLLFLLLSVHANYGFDLGMDFSEVKSTSNITIDLKYTTADNFMNENLYGEFNKCILRKSTAEQLTRAADKLSENID